MENSVSSTRYVTYNIFLKLKNTHTYNFKNHNLIMFFRIKINKNVFQIVQFLSYYKPHCVNVVWYRFPKPSLNGQLWLISTGVPQTKTSLKIRKWWSKAVHWRTDNTLSKRKRTKRTYSDLQTIHRLSEHIIQLLHEMKCCNCFITFNIRISFWCTSGSIFRDYLLFFLIQILKHLSWYI